MTIDEILKQKRKLENDLQDLVAKRLLEFQDCTGYTLSSLDVSMVDITEMLDTRKRFMLGLVKVTINTGL